MRNESDLSRDAAFTNEVIAFADSAMHTDSRHKASSSILDFIGVRPYVLTWFHGQVYCNEATDVYCEEVHEPCRWKFCNSSTVESPTIRDNISSIGPASLMK